MNYKKLSLTVAAGAMATTMMAQSAPQLNANNIEEVIKNKTFLPFQSFANFVKKKKKIVENLVGII